jgi:hypothetical protein
MSSIKAKWKRAPLDQRRVTSERVAPKARFTRSQRSGSLPPSLPSSQSRRSLRPLLIFALVTVVLVSLGVTLVIAVGAYLRAEQNFREIEQRAGAYGLPTQPFATLNPEAVLNPAPTDNLPALPASSYPPSAAPDDPRWVSGSAAPLDTRFSIHAAPALNTAPPLLTVSETTDAAFITALEWGIWAQIRLGDTIGWVDTSTVRLSENS